VSGVIHFDSQTQRVKQQRTSSRMIESSVFFNVKINSSAITFASLFHLKSLTLVFPILLRCLHRHLAFIHGYIRYQHRFQDEGYTCHSCVESLVSKFSKNRCKKCAATPKTLTRTSYLLPPCSRIVEQTQ
jgi:hypothetical protein